MTRPERPYAEGDRIRFMTPGYSFDGDTGTVVMDTPASSALFALRDSRLPGHAGCEVICGTAEVEMIEDQTPNPAHARLDSEVGQSFWWRQRDLRETRRRLRALGRDGKP